jgi:hypothetical protein
MAVKVAEGRRETEQSIIERTEGRRGDIGDRWLQKRQRAVEGTEGRRGDRGLLNNQKAIKGTESRTGDRGLYRIIFSRKTIIVWNNFFREKRSETVIIINPTLSKGCYKGRCKSFIFTFHESKIHIEDQFDLSEL